MDKNKYKKKKPDHTSNIPEKLLARYHHLNTLNNDDALMSEMHSLFSESYNSALDKQQGIDDPQLGVYLHLPFCPTRCLSCERNSVITQDSKKIDEYLVYLEKESSLIATKIGTGRRLTQLHIGGGTPNYLTDPQLVQLMDILDRYFTIDDSTETSIEANPRRACATQLELLKGLGFKEIDYGVRDVNDNVQSSIGRVNTFSMLLDVFTMTHEIGFESISLDFMYGLPAQNLQSIQDSMEKIIMLKPERIDCFSYVRSTDKLPHQVAIDSASIPSRAAKLTLFNEIANALTESDYTWVGLECFAANESKLANARLENTLRRNWIGYTINPAKNLIGLGINACSEVDGLYVQNYLNIDDWKNALDENRLPIEKGIKLDQDDLEKRDGIISLLCNPDLSQSHSLLTQNPEFFKSTLKTNTLSSNQSYESASLNG